MFVVVHSKCCVYACEFATRCYL